MKTPVSISIPEQYCKILENCRKNDPKAIRRILKALIKSVHRQDHIKNEFILLYSICLQQLEKHRISEIKKTFERLVNDYVSVVEQSIENIGIKYYTGVNVTACTLELANLQTNDPELAERLSKISRSHLYKIPVETDEPKFWNFTVLKDKLPSVLKQLKTPQYLRSLNRFRNDQLAIDFN
ncbi:hypothetical protein ACFL7D_10890 [candidate division KSB1 bacterium]